MQIALRDYVPSVEDVLYVELVPGAGHPAQALLTVPQVQVRACIGVFLMGLLARGVATTSCY